MEISYNIFDKHKNYFKMFLNREIFWQIKKQGSYIYYVIYYIHMNIHTMAFNRKKINLIEEAFGCNVCECFFS